MYQSRTRKGATSRTVSAKVLFLHQSYLGANYWWMIAMAAWSYRYMPEGSIRNTLILTPVLPALMVVASAYWIYEACDEFIRLMLLKCVVITAIAVAIFTLGYFFLELFGFPRLSMLAVNLFGWSVFNLLMVYVIIRSR
jgi:hypothetical protein